MELDLETIGTLSGPDAWGAQISRLKRLNTDGRTYGYGPEVQAKRTATRNLNKARRRALLFAVVPPERKKRP